MENIFLLTWVYQICYSQNTMNDSDQFLTVSVRYGVCGVYLLLRGGEVVYAGQSLNVFARIGVHHQTMVRKRKGLRINPHIMKEEAYVEFDEVRIKQCAKSQLDKEEMLLIQRYLPQHNTLMKRVEQPKQLAKLREMPFFQEFMRKEQLRQSRMPMKKRKLPPQVAKVEQEFQTYRDKRIKVSLPHLKCLEDEHAG